MRILSICILALAVALVAGSMASATNLAANGDFETWSGAVAGDGWTYYYGGTATNDNLSYGAKASTWTEAVPSPKYYGGSEGQRVAVIYKGKVYSHAGVAQTIAVTPGVTYRISAWLTGTTTGWIPIVDNLRSGFLGVEDGSLWRPSYSTFTGNAASANWAGFVQTDSVWVQRTIDFTPTAATMTVFLDGYHNTTVNNSGKNMHLFFDDVTVEAIPEPSSMLALLTGLPIIGYAIRRRKA